MKPKRYQIPKELERAYELFLQDMNVFEVYAKKFLRIKDEHGNIVAFVLNNLQKKVLYIILELEKRGLPIWLIILKCRQTGISTLVEAYLFWKTHKEFNQKCLIIGHEQDSSQNLFDMFQRYYENLDEGIKPVIDRNQRDKKITYKETKNEVTIQTAGANIGGEKAGTGRSATFQYIHATEAAFYPDYKTTFSALKQASKKAKMFVIETTANGFNEFRNDWTSAKEGASDYTCIFLSWLEFYSKEFRTEEEKNLLLRDLGSNPNYNLYDNEENILIKEYGATLENLYWRRWAIVNLCNKDISVFHQEYPRDDIEAFVSTGNPVFPTHITAAHYAKYHNLETQNKLPLRRGNLIVEYDLVNENYQRLVNMGMNSYQDLRQFIKDVKFVDDKSGFISILGDYKYNEGESYKFCAAVDVAEGLAQGDYSVCQILNRKTKEVVIEWHGHLDVDLFSIEIHKLQIFLKNDVHFGIEKNNQGLAVIIKCYQLGVNLYYQEDFQSGIPKDSERLGFSTNKDSRNYALNNLIEWVRESIFTFKSSNFYSECLTFVKNPKGKMQAMNKDRDPSTKCYDDRIITAAILTVVHQWLPNYHSSEVKTLPYHLEKKLKKHNNQKSVMSE